MNLAKLTFCLALLAGCSGGGDSFTVGAAGPWKESYGTMTRRGIELAIEEINSAGGINGRPMRVVARDDEADGARAAAIAQEFVANPEILAVIGHVTSGAMLAASRIYNGELSAVATTASSPDLSGVSPWVFRVISSDSLNGVILARFASRIGGNSASLKQAAILYENDAYGRGLADAFRRAFRGTIVSFDPISENIEDAEPFISYLKMRQPGIVFVAGREGSALRILREARRQQLDAVFIGGDGWQSIVSDSAVAEGVYVGTSFNAEDPGPAIRKFVEAFERRYDAKPDAFAALAYDATRLVAKALQEKGRSRNGVREFLSSLSATEPFEGLTGPSYFNTAGDPIGAGFRVAQIVNGTLRSGGARLADASTTAPRRAPYGVIHE
ncbi:MAG TPA: ABC transporter substrate-binding protein [Gemmatimonadaceae bacterium]|nr:ABC transporter substrate-binding protein [Gemmatimonadaceae bacterium]